VRALGITGAAALVAVVTSGVASAATGPHSSVAASTSVAAAVTTGVAPQITVVSSSEPIETPSGTYLRLTAASFRSTVAGPVTVRFSGNAYASDWTGPDPRFVGRSYAALLVRVLLDGAPLAPGTATLGDNTGKVSVNAARPKAASFEWTGSVPAGGHRIEVQFRNRSTWDLGGLTRWSLVIQHA
jgi:hypothetical protein